MQYFDSSEQTGFDDLVDTDIEVIQTASYNEEALIAKIDATGLKKELFACAVQLAVVGWGRGVFGEVALEGSKKTLVEIFDEAGVYYNNEAGTQLDPEDLTPKRLVRIYRYQISKWIARKRSQSFLLRKYGAGRGPELNPYIFPGAEHLLTNRAHALVLLECYQALDNAQGSHFTERLRTVFRSRGVLTE
jgi:hypothetical protein